VGCYLTGNVYSTLHAYLEELVGTPSVNNDGALDHALIPRFNHQDGKKRDYVGGFDYQLNYEGFMFPYQAHNLKGFGHSFKEQVRHFQPGFVHIDPWGKVLAQRENRVTVDSNQRDAFGIAIPVVRFRFCENDRALLWDSLETAKEILHLANARIIIDPGPEPLGLGSHETGTTRMGSDLRTSVVNSFCRTHDVKNLL
jgi:choline dehydrogenase-like flavoprotein